MSDNESDITSLSPQKLLEPFSKTRIWQYLAIAVVIHVVVLLVTSIGYLRTRITGEKPAEAAVPAEQQNQSADGAANNNAEPAPATSPGAASNPAASSPAATPTDNDAAMMEKYKDTKVIKDITEKAKPDEIPDAPDLGISIEDTKIE